MVRQKTPTQAQLKKWITSPGVNKWLVDEFCLNKQAMSLTLHMFADQMELHHFINGAIYELGYGSIGIHKQRFVCSINWGGIVKMKYCPIAWWQV